LYSESASPCCLAGRGGTKRFKLSATHGAASVRLLRRPGAIC
jgi:hypothetical protein